jgi:hypothetical protein
MKEFEFTIKGTIKSDNDDIEYSELALGNFLDDIKLAEQTVGVMTKLARESNQAVEFVTFSFCDSCTVIDFKEYHD